MNIKIIEFIITMVTESYDIIELNNIPNSEITDDNAENTNESSYYGDKVLFAIFITFIFGIIFSVSTLLIAYVIGAYNYVDATSSSHIIIDPQIDIISNIIFVFAITTIVFILISIIVCIVSSYCCMNRVENP